FGATCLDRDSMVLQQTCDGARCLFFAGARADHDSAKQRGPGIGKPEWNVDVWRSPELSVAKFHDGGENTLRCLKYHAPLLLFSETLVLDARGRREEFRRGAGERPQKVTVRLL